MPTPPKFKHPRDLAKLLDKYLKDTKEDEYTLTGLIIAAGTNKMTFNDYAKKPGFKDIILMAKMKVEKSYELHLKHNNSSGSIFALKNFGWTDKQEFEHTGNPNRPIEVKTKLEISEEDRQLIEEMKNRTQ